MPLDQKSITSPLGLRVLLAYGMACAGNHSPALESRWTIGRQHSALCKWEGIVLRLRIGIALEGSGKSEAEASPQFPDHQSHSKL